MPAVSAFCQRGAHHQAIDRSESGYGWTNRARIDRRARSELRRRRYQDALCGEQRGLREVARKNKAVINGLDVHERLWDCGRGMLNLCPRFRQVAPIRRTNVHHKAGSDFQVLSLHGVLNFPYSLRVEI